MVGSAVGSEVGSNVGIKVSMTEALSTEVALAPAGIFDKEETKELPCAVVTALLPSGTATFI